MLNLAPMSPSLLSHPSPRPWLTAEDLVKNSGLKTVSYREARLLQRTMSLHPRTTTQHLSSALGAPPFVQSHCVLLESSQESLGFQEWVLWGPFCQQVWGKRPDDTSEQSREWGKPLQGNVQYAGHTQAVSLSQYSSSLE